MTPRQLEVWKAVQRHGGPQVPGAQAAAARDLGSSQASISSALTGYARAMGLNRDFLRPPAPPEHPLSPRERKLLNDLAAADRRIEELRQLAQTAVALVDMAERLERIEKLLAPRPIDHRRIADGGRRSREQRRRRVAA